MAYPDRKALRSSLSETLRTATIHGVGSTSSSPRNATSWMRSMPARTSLAASSALWAAWGAVLACMAATACCMAGLGSFLARAAEAEAVASKSPR